MKPGITGVNYQDSVSTPLCEEADNDAATQEGDDGIDLACGDPDGSGDPEFILPAVDKESASKSCYPFQPWLTVL
jgi:hypothetical protein